MVFERFAGLFLLLTLVLLAGCAEAPADRPQDPGVDDDQFVQVGHDRLRYRVEGEGCTVVLVAGGSGMDLRQWESVAPTLSERFHTVLVDPRGVGGSANPTEIYSDAGDLVLVFESLGIDRAVVIGLSSAGGVVLDFAVLHPNLARGVVAAAPFVPGFEFNRAMLERLAVFNAAAVQGKTAFIDSMLEDEYFIPAPLEPEVRTRAREIIGENFDKQSTIDADLYRPASPPLIERLDTLSVPALLIVGELDHPEVRRRNSFLVDTIPNASERVVPAAGHNSPMENPEAFLEAVIPFLEERCESD